MKEKDEEEEDDKNDLDVGNLSDKVPHKINNQKDLEEKESLLSKTKDKTDSKTKDKTDIKTEKKKNRFKCEKIGFTYILLRDKNNHPLITIGPHWIMFLIFFLFITGGFLFLFIFYRKVINLYLFVVGVIIYLIFAYTFIYILVTDPGIPKRIDEKFVEKSKNKYMYCNICKNWVTIESNTKHCSQCNICIEGHNHHCSWTSKCIGKNNLLYFYFLICWTVVIILYYTFAFLIVHDNWLKYKKQARLESLKSRNN